MFLPCMKYSLGRIYHLLRNNHYSICCYLSEYFEAYV
jgi:hypothetical protein